MVGSFISCGSGGDFGLLDDLGEVAPLAVFQKILQVAGEPELDAFGGDLGGGFEVLGEGLDDLWMHKIPMTC